MIIRRIKIENFKSIKKVDIALNNINILVGPNGTGKSNFIQFFRMLNNIVGQDLQNYVAELGGADNLLYFGRKFSNSIKGEISFGSNEYVFKLSPTEENSFYFNDEICTWINSNNHRYPRNIADGNKETNLLATAEKDVMRKAPSYILQAMTTWWVYHFHDTSASSKLKQPSNINDNIFFRRDGSNLAAYLFLLQERHGDYFKRIEKTIRIIAPFFNGFNLRPSALNPDLIRLEWKHENSDQYFNASHLSDGTLRMICLITLLLQPNIPDTIIIDEPELGLHPSAIQLLASLIKSLAAKDKQVICSTQSVTLLNQFDIEDIIVVERESNESKFKKFEREELSQWLNDYAIGELWEKNVLGGRP